jgi:ribosomal small subunit protein bTHX
MGKGDQRTKRGKLSRGTFGKSRLHKPRAADARKGTPRPGGQTRPRGPGAQPGNRDRQDRGATADRAGPPDTPP